MNKITEIAKNMLHDFPQIRQPASLSGKYHHGDSLLEHLEKCANIMSHLCDGMGIKEENKDMLVACAWLHDIGKLIISREGESDAWGSKYYEATGWSRLEYLMRLHPLISARIIQNYNIPRKKEIQRIVSVHMGHWYKECPQPENLYEYLMVEADYLSTKLK